MTFHTFKPIFFFLQEVSKSTMSHLDVNQIGTIKVTPLQKSPALWDYRPTPSSPCVAVTPTGTGREDASEALPPRPLKGET